MRWYHLVIAILLIIIAVLAWTAMKNPPTPPPPTVFHATSTKPTTAKPAPAPVPLSAKVTVTSPTKGSAVRVPFTVTGQAPGQWFFEATFPMQVRDANDNVIGRGHANAQGDWMTQKEVAFVATINLDTPYTGPATLILLKDNPSGLPENDDSVTIPIVIQ